MAWTATTLSPKSTWATTPRPASAIPATAQPVGNPTANVSGAMPAFLQPMISGLNAGQGFSGASNPQAAWLQAIFGALTGQPSGADAYSRVNSPGARAEMLAGMPPAGPAMGNTTASMNPADAFQKKVAGIQQQKAALGPARFGAYQNSPQQRLDQKLFDAQFEQSPTSQLIGPTTTTPKSQWGTIANMW